jgi:small subunit ribosomal protein S16
MIKIRLSRGGVRKKPFYQIVAIDERRKNKGKYLDLLGFWQPQKNTFRINKELMQKWLGRGAKISPAVTELLKKNEKTA